MAMLAARQRIRRHTQDLVSDPQEKLISKGEFRP
jgi:hypothetical protein